MSFEATLVQSQKRVELSLALPSFLNAHILRVKL
jgi:hypothetical protein